MGCKGSTTGLLRQLLFKLCKQYFPFPIVQTRPEILFRENVSNRPELDKQTSLVWKPVILKFYLDSFSSFLTVIVQLSQRNPLYKTSVIQHKITTAFKFSIITTIITTNVINDISLWFNQLNQKPLISLKLITFI